MSAILVITRAQYPETPDFEAVKSYHESVWNCLTRVDGYESAHLWIDLTDPLHHLRVTRYRDFAAAEAGLEVVAKERLLREAGSVQPTMMDVIRVKVFKDSGRVRSDLGNCPYLSLSIRVSEPGHTRDLKEDLEMVFQESSFIEGFLGYAIGANDALEEEVLGLAGWDSEAAYAQSLPPGIIPAVHCYRKAW